MADEIVVQPDDPTRCQGIDSKGQCHFKSVEGTNFCARHGGANQKAAQNRRAANNYRLEIWQRRLDEFTETESVKSLRDEIGILRIVMEETLNRCEDAHALMLHSNKITDLAGKIEKLVMSCDRLERNMGLMLDKSAAITLASRMVEAISSVITDPNQVDQISEKIIDILGEL